MLYGFGMLLARMLLALLRTKRVVTGAPNIPNDGGAILAGTHFGYFEFGFIASAVWRHDRRKLSFMITKGAFTNPILGYLLRSLGQIPVDLRAGAAAFDAAVIALRGGALIAIFPEAGVDPSFTVRPLKTGAVRLAAQAGVPLVPVGVWGGQRLTTREHRVRFFERFGIPVRIRFGTPVPHDGEHHGATEELRVALKAIIASLQDGYPDDGTGQWWQPAALGGTAPTPEEAAILDAAVIARREARRAESRPRATH